MKNHRRIIICALLITTICACNNWLEVTPSNQIELTEQTQSVEGFMQMLNGAYIAMAQRDLYGEQLMFGDIEFLAQNHNAQNNSWDVGFSDFSYEAVPVMGKVENIWGGLYNAIANVNIILDNIDERQELFIDEDFKILKGEALALRAFLHFDVLRLFGERYAEENLGNVQIPYVLSAELVRYRHLPMDSVYMRLQQDLDQAQTLLASSDPLNASYSGFLFPPTERIYHLNYHALLALKARIFMTRGTRDDFDSAYFYASKVLAEREWSYATPGDFEAVGNGTATADPLQSTEIIWALNVSNLPAVEQQTFGEVSVTGGYTTADEVYNGADRIYDVDGNGAFDLRYNNLLGPHPSDFAQNAVSLKYDQAGIQFNDLDFYDHLSVPMFRMTELILNRAEVILEIDRNETIAILNELREARGVLTPDPNYTGFFNPQLREEVIKEYRKELFMEGQMFFIYKRLGFNEIPDSTSPEGMITVTVTDYQFPLPFDELELGNR